MGHEEEIESSLHNFGLLNEAVINISTLRRVQDVVLARFLEESLSNTLVDDDECDMGERLALALRVIFICENLLQLVKLKADDLLAHRIADSITIDENMVWQSATVK